MPYEVESPLGAALGAAGAFYSGQEAQRRQRVIEQQEQERIRNTAAATAAMSDYRMGQLDLGRENVDLKNKLGQAGLDLKKLNAQTAQQRVKDAKQKALWEHNDRILARETARIIASNHDQAHKDIAIKQIQAAARNVQARINSNELISSERVDAEWGRIRATVDNNIRTTATSRANNENTVRGSFDRAWLQEGGRDERFNAGQQNAAARNAQNASVRAKHDVAPVPTSRSTMPGQDPIVEGHLHMMQEALRAGATLGSLHQKIAEQVNAGALTRAQGDELLRRLGILGNQMQQHPQGGQPGGAGPFRLPGIIPALQPAGG